MRMIAASMFVLSLSAAPASAQSIDAYSAQPNVPPTSVITQGDGKVLIVGNFASVGTDIRHCVARLNADGSVDATFADPAVNSVVNTIAVQPDGKLLIGGGFSTVGGQPRNGLARLNADGTLDATLADPGFNSTVWAIAVQPDGRILVAGDFMQIGTHVQDYFARLDANGGFDGSFADPQLCCNVARAVALQSDGHVLIGGFYSQAGGQSQFYLARYSSTGVLDTAFPGTQGPVSAIVVAPDDSVLLNGGYLTTAGTSTRPVARLSPSGVLDPTFGNVESDGSTDTIMLQPNGKVLVGGIFQRLGGVPHHALARLNADGSLDASFADLNFSFNAGDPNGYIYGVAEQEDGRSVVVGNFTLANGQARPYVARVATGDYATRVLVVQPNGAAVDVTWYRLGDGPELARPPLLQHSSNGVDFESVGTMTRVANGWHATVNYDVHGAPFYLRAVGTTSSGGGNGSAGQVASETYSNDTIFGWGFE